MRFLWLCKTLHPTRSLQPATFLLIIMPKSFLMFNKKLYEIPKVICGHLSEKLTRCLKIRATRMVFIYETYFFADTLLHSYDKFVLLMTIHWPQNVMKMTPFDLKNKKCDVILQIQIAIQPSPMIDLVISRREPLLVMFIASLFVNIWEELFQHVRLLVLVYTL